MPEVKRTNIFTLPVLRDVTYDYTDYKNEEQHVLTPALIKLGYKPMFNWYTSASGKVAEQFGSVARSILAISPSGESVIFWYVIYRGARP